MRPVPSFAALCLLCAPVHAAPPAEPAGNMEALRALDLRLATIAQRLVTGNAALCRDLQPAPGLVIHARDQYDATPSPALLAAFGFATPVAVEAVVPGSAAARGGVQPNDALVAINGRAVPLPAGKAPTSATRDAAAALLASQPATAPLTLEVIRGGIQRMLTLPAQPGCRVAVEVLPGAEGTPYSTGTAIQVGEQFLLRFDDADVAAVMAHELAHIVLAHRARREAAGVGGGLFKELGRSGRLLKQTEIEADRLSVHLLANAGYDPASAPRFWRMHGREIDAGIFRSRIYPSPAARAALLEEEIAATPANVTRPYLPPLLATRDQPLR